MKVTGFASQNVFQHFYSEYKKGKEELLKKTILLEARQAQDLRKRQYFTPWENKVRRKFHSAFILFDAKFRIFPLIGSDGKEYIFVPDFTLKDYEHGNGKRILIEANEDLNESDKPMYSAFIQTYGQLYHLIMIVTDNQLRLWNASSEKLFDDIWTIEDIDYFIADLKKRKKITVKQPSKIDSKLAKSIIPESLGPTKMHLCIGCRKTFDTPDVTQIYCSICLSRFNI